VTVDSFSRHEELVRRPNLDRPMPKLWPQAVLMAEAAVVSNRYCESAAMCPELVSDCVCGLGISEVEAFRTSREATFSRP
jgi:hypothetical protein